jgi:excisionase family DNA binding protein
MTMYKPFTIVEFAAFMGISKRMAAELVATGAVRSVRVGRLVRIPAEAVGELLGVEYVNKEGDKPLLSVAEVGERGGWTAPHTYKLLRSGELQSVLIGGRRMITAESLAELLGASAVAS